MNFDLIDKFLIISHHPHKSRFLISDLALNVGVTGALLLEMSFNEEFEIKKGLVYPRSLEGGAISKYPDIYNIIKKEKRPQSVQFWIRKLSKKAGKIKWEHLKRLAAKEIFKIEEKKLLWLFSFNKVYIQNSEARDMLVTDARESILSKTDINSEGLALLSLLRACKMHQILATSKREAKAIKKELKAIMNESPIAQKVGMTLQQIQAAAIAAIVASTVTTVTIANSR